MTTDNTKLAAQKADAFELGMHALLKEAGVQTREEADHFLKIAAALAQFETKEAALKALKEYAGKGLKKLTNPDMTLTGLAPHAALLGGAGVVGAKMTDKDKKKKPLFDKKK